MNRKAQRAALIKEAQDIIAKGDLADEATARLEVIETEVKSLTEQIERAEKGDALLAQLGALGSDGVDEAGDDKPAKSLGEHFVKAAKSAGSDALARLKTNSGFTVGTTEFKAATDTHVTPGVFQTPLLTDVDRTFVRVFQRPLITDLFGTGTISGNAITYFVEQAPLVEGEFETVAPTGQKPQIHITDPVQVTESLKKIAAWFDVADEMIEDAAFWVSEINSRGLRLLGQTEEDQVLNGDGSGQNLLGLLNRTGVQTETSAAPGDNPDALFRAIAKVQSVTGLNADALVINPADYQALRLSKDANGQYFGGGFFQGQYGNGGIMEQPPVWGLRTIVSAAVAVGDPVVGAFGTAATLYRKGGVRVESTNSDQGKFTTNVVTTRIEERIALAVRVPAAFVKVTLANGS